MRDLTLVERLLMYDVLEMLIRGATSDQGRKVMLDMVGVPGKVLQSVAGSLEAALRKANLLDATTGCRDPNGRTGKTCAGKEEAEDRSQGWLGLGLKRVHGESRTKPWNGGPRKV